MEANEELKKEIENFQNFLISDIWDLLEQVNG
jgi:hypothetical protein